MAWTIPNVGAAGNADQAEVHEADLRQLARGFDRFGVISGCAVTAQGAPDMTVAVAAGSVLIDSQRVTVTAGNSAAMTADATNPRYYLIEIDTSGAIQLNAGSPVADPQKPAVTSTRVVLAEVYIPAADTAIESGQIVDKRLMINDVRVRVGDALSGSPALDSPFYIQAATTVVTLASNEATITFPEAFPTGVLAVIATNGDTAASTSAVIGTRAATTSQFVVRSAAASGTYRVNWLAFGW